MNTKRKGFTFIELLIVLAIIAILASIAFVALDPLKRFQDSRDSTRANDVIILLDAILTDQVDNGGTYLTSITNMASGDVYMISDANSGCHDSNDNCVTNVTSDSSCLDISGLVDEGYLGAVPISPDGNGDWNSGKTGYTVEKESTGIIHVRACEYESVTSTEISASG